MKRDRWDIRGIPWYFSTKDKLGKRLWGLQLFFLCVGILKGIPSVCTFQLWKCLVCLSDFPQRLHLSANGFGAAANALGITGAIFIWIVNLASQQVCTVPMKRLYEWAYPRYLRNFVLSELLLLCCVYSGTAAGQDGSPVQAMYFFVGGLCGFVYILLMCMDFVFSAPKLKNIAHSYVICKINHCSECSSDRERLWEQHLLEDCYDCLEGEFYENLETILNESFTEGYEGMEAAFIAENPQAPSRDRSREEKEIHFFSEQSYMWRTIVNNKAPAVRFRLMSLDVDRMRSEIVKKEFLPKFHLTQKAASNNSTRSQPNNETPLPEYCTEAFPGRICWFFALTQYLADADFSYTVRKMYDWAVKRLVEQSQSLVSQKLLDCVFHELLISSYIYFSLDDAYAQNQATWYPSLVRIWTGISTEFVLSEDRFDILFSWGTLMYAAVSEWTYDYYVRQEPSFRRIAYSIKSSLSNQALVDTVQLR